MSNASGQVEQQNADAPVPETPAAAPRKRGLLILAIAGLVIGGGSGAMVLPSLLGHGSAADSAKTAKPVAPAPLLFHSIENLVVNPAGTNGTRFLLVSASIEVPNEVAAQQVRDHELEVRDRMVTLLSSKTIAELTDATSRDSLKVELRRSIGALFAPGVVRNIYFPQYVLQ
jgi:flagellar basal body-associated protein FliL